MSSIFGEGALAAGFALGTASILSIGPNRLMMIREGVVRGRVAVVASLVFLCEAAVLVASLLLADGIATAPSLLGPILSWLALPAIFWFAFLALRAALSLKPVGEIGGARRETLRACIRRVLVVVWLNPLTYVELLLIPSAVCRTFEGTGARLQFILGLVLMCALGCFGYTFGGGVCASFLKRDRALQAFDIGSGLILLFIGGFMTVSLLL